MALVVKDRVKETTATTGQGTLTLAGAVSGFQSFTSALSNGDTTYYAIFETSTGEWEVGLGTFTATGTTLARTTILESSNSGSAINLTAGAADVFITQPAEKAVYLDSSDNVTFADNEKAIFGTGSDLEIYHDGSNSIIDDTGTGNLQLKTSAGDVDIYNSAGNLAAKFGGDTHLYTNGTEILRTQSSAIAVVGSVNKLSSLTSGSLGTTSIRWDAVYADDMYVADAIIHNGDTDTKMEFSTNTINFDTAGSQRMRIDSSGNVGIGTTSPSSLLDVDKSQNSETNIELTNTNTGSDAQVRTKYTTDGGLFTVGKTSDAHAYGGDAYVYNVDNTNIRFATNDTERMRIDSSGNVGIGTTSPSAKVHSVDSNGNVLRLQRDGAFTGSWDVDIGSYTTGDFTIYDNENSQRAISIAKLTGFSSTSAMYIDSSGNVLVGTTDNAVWNDTSGTGGINLRSDGILSAARNGGEPVLLNRIGTDGELIKFNKNGTTVGSIGTVSSTLVIGSGDTGLLFSAGDDVIIPRNSDTSARDAAIDLGDSTNRFKDLYLSNSAYVGDKVIHDGDTDTYVGFVTNGINVVTGGTTTAFNSNGVFIMDGSLAEDYDALSGTSPTCNVDNAGAFSLTMTGNTTFTFSGADSGYGQGFILQLTGNGSTVTWPASVDWAGGTAPDAPASGETDILVFWTRDGGTTWYGFQAGDAMA